MIFNNQGKVFLSKRGKNVRNEKGFWEFPGGAVNFGETLANAIIREFNEEYSIQIQTMELLCVTDHILIDEKQHWVSPTFLGIIISGEPKINEPEKCSEIGWFFLSQLPQPLMTVSKNNVNEYVKKYGELPFNEVIKQKKLNGRI